MITAVANQKGGVGKTTTSVNLSACIADLNKRVLLIDFDPQGNATSSFGITKSGLQGTIYDCILRGQDINTVILPTIVPNLSIVPADMELAGAEIELVTVPRREMVLKQALSALQTQYDYIFIDCPPSLSLLTLNAFAAADNLLVPVQSEFFALEGLTQLMNTVRLVKRQLNRRLMLEGLVLTMYDSRTNLSQQVLEELKRFFEDRVHRTLIPRNVRLAEAPSHGVPVNRYDATCPGAVAYAQLAREFCGLEGI